MAAPKIPLGSRLAKSKRAPAAKLIGNPRPANGAAQTAGADPLHPSRRSNTMNMMTKIEAVAPRKIGAAPFSQLSRTARGSEQFVLPAVPANISSELAGIVAEYTVAFLGDCDQWYAAARRVRGFKPATFAELATKLLIGLHYQDPEICEGGLAIGAPSCRDDRLATEMAIDCLDWALRFAVPPVSPEWEAAEEALRQVDLELEDPAIVEDEDVDRLADIRGEKVDAILALPAQTPAQALRKIELAMFDDHMVRTGSDFPAVFAEAKRVILGQHAIENKVPVESRLEPSAVATGGIDPHPSWLTERGIITARLESSADKPEEQADRADRLNALDNLILSTPATTREGASAKLLTVVKALSEGHVTVEEDAARIVAEVQPLLEMPASGHGATGGSAGLSPVMSKIVAAWADASRAFGSFSGPDEICDALCEASHTLARAVANTPAETHDDLAIKVYMLALVECDQTGPQPLVHKVAPEDAEYEQTHLWSGIIADLPRISPAVRDLIASAS
jgi:hypothetical protein